VHHQVIDLAGIIAVWEAQVTEDNHVFLPAEGPGKVVVHLPLGLNARSDEAIRG
jgi:hypothetical protein